MRLYEETLSTTPIYDGKIISLRRDTARLENGREVAREVISHPGGVCIVAVDEEDRLLLVRQFRYPFSRVLTELPAGKLNYGEDPLRCGQRELEEETGCTADRFVSLGQFLPTPAYCEEVTHIYYASGLHTTHQHLDPDEFLDVERIPFEEAVRQVLAGELADGKTQIGILKAKLLRDSGQLG